MEASEDRLLQAFENVLDNAVSFSPPGGVVSVATALDGNAIVTRISDEGPGISEQHRVRIFDRFFTYRPATAKLSSTDIRDLMTGAKARVAAGMGGDSVTLTVSGDTADLERAMQLAYVLLTEPIIEPAESTIYDFLITDGQVSVDRRTLFLNRVYNSK